jgi:hypothetical protein
MADIFSGARTKLARARKFASELREEESRWAKSGPITLAKVQDQIEISFNVPDTAGAIIGDAIHNMRAALDHMATEICEITTQSTKKVYFPFSASEGELDRQIKEKNFDNAGTDAISLLKDIKPYRGGNEKLRAIHDIDIIDKHRALVVTPSTLDFELRATFNRKTGELVNSATNVESMRFKMPADTVFADQEAHETLQELIELVEGVLNSFQELVQKRAAGASEATWLPVKSQS